MTSECFTHNAIISPIGCACRDQLGVVGKRQDDDAALSSVSGFDRLNDRKLNRGLAFTKMERVILGIEGLLAPAVRTIEEQATFVLRVYYRMHHRYPRFLYLMNIYEKNERLFFKCMSSNLKLFLEVIYIPTVGHICKDYCALQCYQRGIVLTMDDKQKMFTILKNWPEKFVRCVIVSNGQSVLGLGDMGLNAMGVIIGQSIAYTAIAGIKPTQLLPVYIDMGTDNMNVYTDPQYTGIKRKRCLSEDAIDLMDEFMEAITRRFGHHCLIHFSFFNHIFVRRLLNKYKKNFVVYTDDLQGSACAIMAGLMGALRHKSSTLDKETIFLYGAGPVMQIVAKLCVIGMMKMGLTETVAKKRIWGWDEHGLIVKNQPNLWLEEGKFIIAQNTTANNSFFESLKLSKATILIGTKNERGAFSKEILMRMAKHTEKPIIFALSSPQKFIECTAEDAYIYTQGKCIFASFIYFSHVRYMDQIFYPRRITKYFTSSGIVLGVVTSYIKGVPEGLLYHVAKRLAELLSRKELAMGCLYPVLRRINHVTSELALVVMNYGLRHGLTNSHLEPVDKLAYIKSQLYNPDYPPLLTRVDEMYDDPCHEPPKLKDLSSVLKSK